MRELVAKFVADRRYAVSDALFVYRNGQFARFGRKRRRYFRVGRLFAFANCELFSPGGIRRLTQVNARRADFR